MLLLGFEALIYYLFFEPGIVRLPADVQVWGHRVLRWFITATLCFFAVDSIGLLVATRIMPLLEMASRRRELGRDER